MTTSSPALGIEFWDIADVLPHPRNAKKHSPEQIDKLALLIKENGWTQPIVVWKDKTIIAGHGRRLAALKLGMKRVPVIQRNDLTETQADALRLADNRVASTEYDIAIVQEEIARLAEQGFDLSLTAYDANELEALTADMGAIDDDLFVEDVGAAVEEQKEQNTKKAAEIDGTAAPLVDAFGFKRVSVEQARRIRSFISKIEGETGQKGAGALDAFITKKGYA